MKKGRIIGIRHRIKRTKKEGVARPTQIAVWEAGEITTFKLEDETAELEWVKGAGPNKSEGLRPNDAVLMALGGSGDYLAFAISRQGEKTNARILRVAPPNLKEFRGHDDKENDAQVLINLYQQDPTLFRPVGHKERDFIRAGVLYRSLSDAMKARIACEQRIFQQLVGEIFCRENGLFPEGGIEKAFKETKANDQIFQNLMAEEKKRETALEKALEKIPIYTLVNDQVKGFGPRIAGRLLIGIGDINRFPTTTRRDGGITHGKAKLKAYAGVGLTPDGKFRRRRGGEVANWSNECRQALYLLMDQFNRRPDTPWGQKLLGYKAKLKQKHPVPICKNCSHDDQEVPFSKECKKAKHKMSWNDGHILTTAKWKTVTKFVEWLWREWTRLENSEQPALPKRSRVRGERADAPEMRESI